MNTGTQKKTKRSGISPLAVLFVALIILFFIGCGAIFFFMEGTNIHQGISGFVRECFMRILLAIVAAVVLVCCVKAILSPERTVKSVLLCLLGCILSIIIPFFMLKSMFLDFPYLNHPPAKSVFRYGLRRGRSHQLSHGRGWNRWKGALF